jgi:hypothetical protein
MQHEAKNTININYLYRIENPRVAGSIPALGTIPLKRITRIFRRTTNLIVVSRLFGPDYLSLCDALDVV